MVQPICVDANLNNHRVGGKHHPGIKHGHGKSHGKMNVLMGKLTINGCSIAMLDYRRVSQNNRTLQLSDFLYIYPDAVSEFG